MVNKENTPRSGPTTVPNVEQMRNRDIRGRGTLMGGGGKEIDVKKKKKLFISIFSDFFKMIFFVSNKCVKSA